MLSPATRDKLLRALCIRIAERSAVFEYRGDTVEAIDEMRLLSTTWLRETVSVSNLKVAEVFAHGLGRHKCKPSVDAVVRIMFGKGTQED